MKKRKKMQKVYSILNLPKEIILEISKYLYSPAAFVVVNKKIYRDLSLQCYCCHKYNPFWKRWWIREGRELEWTVQDAVVYLKRKGVYIALVNWSFRRAKVPMHQLNVPIRKNICDNCMAYCSNCHEFIVDWFQEEEWNPKRRTPIGARMVNTLLCYCCRPD